MILPTPTSNFGAAANNAVDTAIMTFAHNSTNFDNVSGFRTNSTIFSINVITASVSCGNTSINASAIISIILMIISKRLSQSIAFINDSMNFGNAEIKVGKARPKSVIICSTTFTITSKIIGKLSSMPCPIAESIAEPTSKICGVISTIIKSPSERTLPNSDIAPNKPFSLNAVVSLDNPSVPNCTNFLKVGVNLSDNAI